MLKINKIYKILKIFMLSMTIFLTLKSCAKAVDYTPIREEIRANLQKLCEKQAYGLGQYAYETINLSEFYGDNYAIIIGKGNNNNYGSKLSTDYRLYICEIRGYKTLSNQSNDTSNGLYNSWSGIWDTHQYYLNGNKINKGSMALNNLLEPFYCYTTVPINTRVLTLGAGEEHGGSYIVPTFEFNPAGEEVTINCLEVNALKLNNMVIPFNMGQIIDLENYYNVMVSLIDTSNNNVLDVYSTRSGVGNGLLQKSGNGYILASSTRLYYKHIYKLSLDVYEESDSSDNYEYYFIFLPPNAVISSGIIESYGSGDFSNQDLAISNEQNTNELINVLTDTTLSSGEEISLTDLPTLNISSGDDVSYEFFSWLLINVQDILNYSGDTTLEIPIYNNSYYIPSNVFVMNIEPLRTFISAGWWFIVGLPFLKYIRRSIEKLKGGEIPASDEKSDLLGNIL